MRITALLMCISLCTTAEASPILTKPDRLSFSISSNHIGAVVQYNERNPGVFVTWEHPHHDINVGAYKNSFSKLSVLSTVSLQMYKTEDFSFEVFVGGAYYPEDGRTFALHVGDFIPLGGLQVRYKNIFSQIIPMNSPNAKAILTFGVSFSLK